MTTGVTWPADTNPARPPANWSADQGGVGSDLSLYLLSCERFNWGPFERPLKMILELHTNMTPPASCTKGSYEYFQVLNSIWVDDPQVATFLASNLSLPVHLSAITMQTAGTPGLTFTANWSWRPETGQPSDVATTIALGYETHGSARERIAWVAQGRVSLLDMQQTLSGYLPEAVLTPGHMRPPMLLSKMGDPYPGDGDLYSSGDVEGTLYRFADDQCKEPIDPYP